MFSILSGAISSAAQAISNTDAANLAGALDTTQVATSTDIVTGTDIAHVTNAVSNAADGDPTNLLVILLGIGTVFAGLICIVILCRLMSLFTMLASRKGKKSAASAAVGVPAAVAEIPNRQELVAVISAVLAEELGTDVSALRIHSLRQI